MYIDILNRDCKITNHVCCAGYWEGQGIEVWCNCSCHKHHDIPYAKNDEAENNQITYNAGDSKYHNKIIPFNTDYGLEKQNKNNVPVDKSFLGYHQQLPFANGDDRD